MHSFKAEHWHTYDFSLRVEIIKTALVTYNEAQGEMRDMIKHGRQGSDTYDYVSRLQMKAADFLDSLAPIATVKNHAETIET